MILARLFVLVCWLRRRHTWRKPRKDEGAPGMRYCRTCGLGRTVKRREKAP